MSANPSKLQVRVGFEQNAGLGDPSTWVDMRVRSESLGAEFPGIDDDSIIAGADEPEKLESKIDLTGGVPVNFSPEDHAKPIANFFGAGDNPTNPGTGVYVHALANAPHKTDKSYGTLAAEISRDLGQPELLVGGNVSQLQLQLGPRGVLTGALSMLFPRFQTLDDPAVVSAGGTPTLPLVRGLQRYSIDTAADGDIRFKVTSAPSASAMGIKVTVGASGTYTGAEITVTEGVWIALKDANGHIGQGEECPVEVFFPTGSIVTGGSGYALNDIIEIPRDRAVWSQSLPIASALNEVAAYVYVDGIRFRLREFSLTGTRPVVRDEIVGGRFIDSVIEIGKRTWALTLTRRALDRDMLARLRARRPFQFHLQAYGTQIGSTLYRRALELVAMNMIPTGKTPSVGGAAQFDEQIQATAHASSDGTYPAPMTCILTNGQADLAA